MAHMEQTRHTPRIPGWHVLLEDGRTFVATRRHDLTDYQRAWGALPEVDASTADELQILCEAQTHLAERLAAAEVARPRISPHPKVQVRRGDLAAQQRSEL